MLLVLAADVAVDKLNDELHKKEHIVHLNKCYKEIKEYKSFTEDEMRHILHQNPQFFSGYVQDQGLFCFDEYKKEGLPFSPGFLRVAFNDEREDKAGAQSKSVATNVRAQHRTAKLNALKIKHAGRDGLTCMKHLIHQTSRARGKHALVEGLAAYKNSHLLYDGSLARGAGKFFHSIWFSANTRRYRFWDTTIYPYRQGYKCAKAMGLVVDFGKITRVKRLELFVLSTVKRPFHRSKTETT